MHGLRESYIDALLEQLSFQIQLYDIKKFKTVYIGGGTPSTLSINQLQKLANFIFPLLEIDAEATIEANPNSATFEWLSAVKQMGFNRLSLGVQSFDNQKLKFLGRNHSNEIAIKSLEIANQVGFKNINLDLIYNTAFDSKEIIENDINIALTMPINHISFYSLTIEEGTVFEKIGEKSFENIEETEYFFEKINSKFAQYEISNFGAESKHNFGYWNGENYLGVGSGAVGFWQNQRIYPDRDVNKYISNPTKFEIENLSQSDLRFEKLFLGFRSKIGVLKNELLYNEIQIAETFVSENILTFSNGRYFNKNFLLADELALRIFKEN